MASNNIQQEGMLPVGTILRGTYRIEDYLSSGGFGNTYVVTNIEFNERYAIKEFFMRGVNQRDEGQSSVSVSNSANRNSFEEQREKFKKEARRLRQLSNSHVVRVHDLFDENGTSYYVMDFIDGESLSDRLKRTGQPISETEVRNYLLQILDGLEEIHNKGFQHLDLKPANIMVDKQGNITIIDFGASKQMRPDGGATASTAICYTPGYAPREQMEQNFEKFGPWTDLYALGATLYNILTTNKPPMPSDIDDEGDAAFSFPSSVSNEMRSYILWLMQPNRTKRPQKVMRPTLKETEETKIANKETKPSSPSEVSSDETIVGKPRVNPKTKPTPQPAPKPEPPKSTIISNDDDNISSTKLFWIIFLIGAGLVFIFVGLNKCEGTSSNGSIGNDTLAVDSVEVVDTVAVSYAISGDWDSPLGKCYYVGEGTFEGTPHGNGEAKFTDGRYYKGDFFDGRFEGNAYFKYSNGDEFRGKFKGNRFSEGSYKVKSTGEEFEGTFDKKGKPLHGKWYDKNGRYLEKI